MPPKCSYSDKQLLSFLKKWKELHRTTPSLMDWNLYRGDYPSEQVYRSRFGSFSKALEKAGIFPRDPGINYDRVKRNDKGRFCSAKEKK